MMASSRLHQVREYCVRFAASGLVSIGAASGLLLLAEAIATTPQQPLVQQAAAQTPSVGEQLFPQIRPAIVEIKTSDGQGSGVLIRADGLVLTNAHVVDGERTAKVMLHDGRSLEAEVVAVGEQCADLALLKIPSQTNLPTVPLGSSTAVRPGQNVYVIGNPRGLSASFKEGAVSRYEPSDRDIQTTVPLDPGDSGSPLLNQAGQMIGLNTRIIGRALSFSIPVETIKGFLDRYDAGKALTVAALPSTRPTAQKIAVAPAPVTGRLTPNSGLICSDRSYYNLYEFEGKAGQAVMLWMESETFAPYLSLFGPDGKLVAEDVNQPQDQWAVIRQQLPRNGTYRIVTNSVVSQVTGAYKLTVAPLLLLRDSSVGPGNSTLKNGSFYQLYTIPGQSNQEVRVSVFANGFTPYLLLVNADGKVIAKTDKVKPGDDVATLKLRLPRGGQYRVLVSTLKPGDQGDFRLVVR